MITSEQQATETMEVEIIKVEVDRRINKDTSDQELLMWKYMNIDALVENLVKDQIRTNCFRPVVVAKMQLRWMWLKKQAVTELELRGTMEVYSGMQ
jgi:hypothetical protein